MPGSCCHSRTPQRRNRSLSSRVIRVRSSFMAVHHRRLALVIVPSPARPNCRREAASFIRSFAHHREHQGESRPTRSSRGSVGPRLARSSREQQIVRPLSPGVGWHRRAHSPSPIIAGPARVAAHRIVAAPLFTASSAVRARFKDDRGHAPAALYQSSIASFSRHFVGGHHGRSPDRTLDYASSGCALALPCLRT